jgi:tRNA splicing endonuclease
MPIQRPALTSNKIEVARIMENQKLTVNKDETKPFSVKEIKAKAAFH